MLLFRHLLKICLSIAALITWLTSSGQLCTGSLGDPVVNITFGSGTNPGKPLNSSLTSYNFQNKECPDDGNYTITNSTFNCFGSTWHNLSQDHTGNPQGYFMLINASFDPGDFYVETVQGLCSNTTFEFSAWLMNIMKPVNSIKPDITFRIEKLNGEVLATYNSGELPVESSAKWKQYGFFFTTPPGVSSVVIRIRNNAPGGYGNDLCLDDIQFKPCGARLEASIGNTGETIEEFCEGTTVKRTLSFSISNGYNLPVFQWQQNLNNAGWTDIQGATNKTLDLTLAQKGKYEYRVMVAEESNMSIVNCRVASNIITLQIRDNPVITMNTSEAVCEDSKLELKADIDFRNPDNWKTDWQQPSLTPATKNLTGTGNLGLATISIPDAKLQDDGMYTLTATNGFGCASSATIDLTVHSKPIVNFQALNPLCAQKTVQLTGNATVLSPASITSWSWDAGNGSTANTGSFNTIYSDTGTYEPAVFVIASNGCSSDTIRKKLVIHPNPQVNFGLPEVCLADPFALFSDSSSIMDQSEAQFTYLWTFNDPASTPGNPDHSTLKDARHRYSSTGIYDVRLQVTSNNGCAADSTIPFTVNGSVPNARFEVFAGNLNCSDRPVRIIDRSSVDFGNITRVEIYWDYGNDILLKTIDEQPTPGKEYNYVYGRHINTDGQSVRIRYVAYSGINCVSESEQTLLIFKSPSLTFNALAAICEEAAAFQVTGVTESTGIIGSGRFSGTGIDANGWFDPKVAGKGAHPLLYQYTSTNGCIDTAQQYILVYPQPQVNAGPDRTLIIGGMITLEATATGDGLKFKWTPDERMNNSSLLNPIVSPIKETSYTLEVVSDKGCFNSDQVFVKVFEYLVIPNAFTPNGDGKNDTWRVPYLESYPEFEVKIYNRYGQLVYKSVKGMVDWDGRINGKEAPSGTYVYVLDRKQYGSIVKGVLHLIR